jgi:MYXO-CTERM domain-containing protein
MKTHSIKQQLKTRLAIIALGLMAAATPLMAQSSSGSSGASYNNGRTTMNEPAGADTTSHTNWSWLGLLGLFGLLGLRHRQTTDDREIRGNRATA